MANPVLVECTQGEWTPVAVNVVTGYLRKPLINSNFMYFWTSRDTGETAPSNADDTDSGKTMPLFQVDVNEKISSINAQDFYVWVKKDPVTTEKAQIRVDL